MQELSKQGLLCGDKIDKLDFFENHFQKAHRIKYDKRLHKSNNVLAYVHSDLRGLVEVQSLIDKRYFMTYSRKVWLYILKAKYQALEKFKIWKVVVKTQSGIKVKALRIDNGFEFFNKKFKVHCQTIKFTPKQNGLAKRINRSLIDKIRGLLINFKLPKSFYEKFVSRDCYLVNESPPSTTKVTTLEEI